MTNFQELYYRAQIERLITEREGMIALNKEREHRGESLAYSEDSFQILANQFAEIEESIRNGG